MGKGETADYLVERCKRCGLLNVVSRTLGDGSRCADCTGAMVPLGYAVLQSRPASRMSVARLIRAQTRSMRNRTLSDLLDYLIQEVNSRRLRGSEPVPDNVIEYIRGAHRDL